MKPTDNFDLKGIKPSIYKIANNKGTILIYIFKSFQESDNWEGTFTLKYYEHWIEDGKGGSTGLRLNKEEHIALKAQ